MKSTRSTLCNPLNRYPLGSFNFFFIRVCHNSLWRPKWQIILFHLLNWLKKEYVSPLIGLHIYNNNLSVLHVWIRLLFIWPISVSQCLNLRHTPLSVGRQYNLNIKSLNEWWYSLVSVLHSKIFVQWLNDWTWHYLLIDWIFAGWTRNLLCSTVTKDYPHSFIDAFSRV